MMLSIHIKLSLRSMQFLCLEPQTEFLKFQENIDWDQIAENRSLSSSFFVEILIYFLKKLPTIELEALSISENSSISFDLIDDHIHLSKIRRFVILNLTIFIKFCLLVILMIFFIVIHIILN